jgi:Do/DeqQ family serine protease
LADQCNILAKRVWLVLARRALASYFRTMIPMKTFSVSPRSRLVLLAVAVVSLVLLADTQAQNLRTAPVDRQQIQLSFAPVVQAVAPAVVNVYASRTVQQRRPAMFDDPFFQRFFGSRDFGMPRERVVNSLGSGVIVGADGLVVTNNHVIQDATEIRVALNDRREFEAEVLLKDERSDLAVLRLRDVAEALPAVGFGSSDTLEVGDLVLAIGNPFGVGQTVTSGIVSARPRTQASINDMGFFLQTDAAINRGNSGGALVDMSGRLVGINTAIFSRSGGSIGIGFAIPSEMVRLVVASAIEGRPVQRPWVGAQLQPVTSEIARSLGLNRPIGVIVSDVRRGSPADAAGLQAGDIILSVAGQEVSDEQSLRYRLSILGLGGQADLAVLREGRQLGLDLALSTAPEDPPRDVRLIDGPSPFAGASVANLSPALVEELSLSVPETGVVVLDVARRSPARAINLARGDIVISVNGQQVPNTGALAALTAQPERLWRVEISRGGRIISSVFGG